jgi:hypothetical protein
MDVVWICRTGPNEELRYSIRSVAKNMPHENIVVVGGKPDWYKGKFIPVETFTSDNKPSTNKYENAKNNIRHIVDNPDISNDFVLMNDDFYVLKPIDQLQYYHNGLLANKVAMFSRFTNWSTYTGVLTRTMSVLNHLGFQDPLDYTLHIPMMFNKQKLADVLVHPIASIRTLYGNIYKVGGRKMDDVKVHGRQDEHAPKSFDYMNEDSVFLSTADRTFASVKKNLLGPQFRWPSKYERLGY